MGINIVVGFLLLPFIVHSLGDRYYGYWTLAASFTGYYGLLDLGIVSAVQYFVAKTLGERNVKSANKVISTSFFVFALIGVLILCITVIIAYFSKIFIKDAVEEVLFRNVILIIGLGFSIGFPCRVFLGVIAASLRFELVSLVNVGCLLLRTALIIITLNMGYGITAIALITSAVDLFNNFLSYIIVKRIHPEFRISTTLASIAVFKKIIEYSSYSFTFKMAQQIKFSIQPFIVSGFIGIEAVTHFAIASRLSLYFLTFMRSTFGLLTPLFSRYEGQNDKAKMQQAFLLASKFSMYIATFTASSLILYGKKFIEIWMGRDYLDAYIPFVIIVMGVFLDACQFPSKSYLLGVAKHRFLAYITMLEGIATLFLCLSLASPYGLVGVAIGMMIPMSITKLLIQPYYVCRDIKISLQSYYIRVIGLGTLAVVLSLIIPWFIVFRNYSIDSYLIIFKLILIQSIIALPIAYIFTFSKPEMSMIYQLVFKASVTKQPQI
jgi:O-antigen/teichoic acid export membrane protein